MKPSTPKSGENTPIQKPEQIEKYVVMAWGRLNYYSEKRGDRSVSEEEYMGVMRKLTNQIELIINPTNKIKSIKKINKEFVEWANQYVDMETIPSMELTIQHKKP